MPEIDIIIEKAEDHHPFLNKELPIQWEQLKPEYIVPDIELLIQQSNQKINQILKIPDNQLTYENTFKELDDLDSDLDEATAKIALLNTLIGTDEIRLNIEKSEAKVTEFYSHLLLNESLYRKLLTYSSSSATNSLNSTQKYYIHLTLEYFTDNGVELKPEDKAQLIQIDKELNQLTLEFSKNVIDATQTWHLIIQDETQLTGLPENAKKAAKLSALEKGYCSLEKPAWRLTLDDPSYWSAITFLENANLRKTLWEARKEIGQNPPYNNGPIISKILQLRKQKATLLGKNNFADFIIKNRMAKNSANAMAFVDNLHALIKPQFDTDVQTLVEFKSELQHQEPSMFYPWDIQFLIEKKENELFHFSQEVFRPYFPIDSVLQGLFTISEKIFKIHIIERSTYNAVCTTPQTSKDPTSIPVWNSDVKYYDIQDQDGKHIASFYTDWFAREKKRSGAWMMPLVTSEIVANGTRPALAIICGNLTKPTTDKPSLLSLEEVRTIFHEFGHLLHFSLSKVPVKFLYGTKVPKDFVEFPSQVMENWCYEQEALNIFAKHYQTGNSIPLQILDKLKKYRASFISIKIIGQLRLAKMDLLLHAQLDHFEFDYINQYLTNALKNFQPSYTVPTYLPLNILLHLFSDPVGYAAAYYSYQWSNVLEADVFEKLQETGGLNSPFLLKYQDEILRKGNSLPSDELYKNFMDRDPDLQPLLRRYDVKKPVFSTP